MADLKYAPYVLHGATRTELDIPRREQYPFVHVEKEMWDEMDVNCNFAISCVHEPYVMPDLPHSHPFGEYLYFIGSDPDNPEDLNADMEFGMGNDMLQFNTSYGMWIPRGLVYGPLRWHEVRKPHIEMAIMLGAGTLKEGWGFDIVDMLNRRKQAEQQQL